MQRITLVIAILLHVALAIGATQVQEQKRRRRATTVAVVDEKKKEAKKEEDKPKPPPPPPPKPAAVPKAAPEPKAEAAPVPAEAPKVASSEAPEPMSSGLNLSNDGPGMDMGGPAKDPSAGRKDQKPEDVKPKAVKPVVKTEGGEGGSKGEEACTEEPTKPEPISKTEIEYTDQARADGVEGRLVLVVTVGADGSVSDVQVESSVQASLDAAAIASVKQWRFKPAMRCGKPFAGGKYKIARRFELGD